MTPGIAAALHTGGAAAAVRACRRRVQRGGASHLRWRAPALTQLPWVLQDTCHVPPHPRRSPQLIAERGPWATRQCGGQTSCERGRADRLSGVSRLARAAVPHSAYRYAAPGRQCLLSTCVDNGARIPYICIDTCRHP